MRIFSRAFSVWNAVVFFLCAAMALKAQEAGSIQGRVVDPQAAAVPGVKVTIEQQGTQISRTATTGNEGLYSLANVAVGVYAVTAEVQGFKKVVVPNVRVEVAQRVQLDLTLEIGALAETVEVSAAPAPLQTSDSQIGGVVESKAISDLPLNGRNFTQLMILMAGSTERSGGTIFRQLRPWDRSRTASSRRNTRRGRPRALPLALAARRPLRTRSRIISRSSFRERRQDGEREARHGVRFIGVEVLGHRQEAYAQRGQLLDGADAIDDTAAPAIELPDQHGVEAPGP